MNIYFVNKKSSIKGPYDITDSHRQKIIRIGDVVIRESKGTTSFLIVVTEINKWKCCKCIGTSNKLLDIDINILLFTFDGISKRHGNISILQDILMIFDSQIICNFINNAISILSYKCDLWDIDVFNKIHSIKPILIDCEQKINLKIIHNSLKTPYIFEDYLHDEAKVLFITLVNKNTRMRDVYERIRELYPLVFRNAIKAFIRDYPKSTIYDTKNSCNPPTP